MGSLSDASRPMLTPSCYPLVILSTGMRLPIPPSNNHPGPSRSSRKDHTGSCGTNDNSDANDHCWNGRVE
ncbi:hypothetical protein Y032_0014g2359 [Ancylostoma ceylanicum]|uniref:Uncharacterized protein n=1 Tax=Ancylostoma ceylanicum TaxID=53326 RepID=A0A016V933_9BILA|nr:hypothetical protein Y032_0014g2359 [Ancylostoma ceylanicum]